MPSFADIALPIPLPPLTYEIPTAWAPLAAPGARARVRMGPRRLTGVIVRTMTTGPRASPCVPSKRSSTACRSSRGT
jgi:hypothetical protein